MRIIGRAEGRYEIHETPFARAYEWHPAYVVLECSCGEELTLTAQSTTTCKCGTDYSALINDIQEREVRQRAEDTHPWRQDTQAQEEQHARDEASYPKDSPWRYNDITLRSPEVEREVQ